MENKSKLKQLKKSKIFIKDDFTKTKRKKTEEDENER